MKCKVSQLVYIDIVKANDRIVELDDETDWLREGNTRLRDLLVKVASSGVAVMCEKGYVCFYEVQIPKTTWEELQKIREAVEADE